MVQTDAPCFAYQPSHGRVQAFGAFGQKSTHGERNAVSASLRASERHIPFPHILSYRSGACVHAMNVHDRMHRKQVTDEMQI